MSPPHFRSRWRHLPLHPGLELRRTRQRFGPRQRAVHEIRPADCHARLLPILLCRLRSHPSHPSRWTFSGQHKGVGIVRVCRGLVVVRLCRRQAVLPRHAPHRRRRKLLSSRRADVCRIHFCSGSSSGDEEQDPGASSRHGPQQESLSRLQRVSGQKRWSNHRKLNWKMLKLKLVHRRRSPMQIFVVFAGLLKFLSR